jgi:hypothetical protein
LTSGPPFPSQALTLNPISQRIYRLREIRVGLGFQLEYFDFLWYWDLNSGPPLARQALYH